MNQTKSLRVAIIAFNFLLLFTLIGSVTIVSSARNKHSRGATARKSSRGGRASKRDRKEIARASRHGKTRMSKREMRADRQRSAREESAYLAKLEKRAGHKLSKRERAAEMRKFGSRH